jgi:hypothetical protein
MPRRWTTQCGSLGCVGRLRTMGTPTMRQRALEISHTFQRTCRCIPARVRTLDIIATPRADAPPCTAHACASSPSPPPFRYMRHTAGSAAKVRQQPDSTGSNGATPTKPKKKQPPQIKVQVQTPTMGRKSARGAIPQTPPIQRKTGSIDNRPGSTERRSTSKASSRPNSVDRGTSGSHTRAPSAALRAIDAGEVPRYMHHTACTLWSGMRVVCGVDAPSE